MRVSNGIALLGRFSPGVRIAGLAVLAGLALGAGPAAAAPSDWRAACQLKNIPGGASGSIQYDACMHLQSCQTMANAAGREIFGMGCFGIKPDNSAQPVTKR